MVVVVLLLLILLNNTVASYDRLQMQPLVVQNCKLW